MAYEIDFVGVGSDKSKQDADAICLRWKYIDPYGCTKYKVGVVDGGFEVHGDAMTAHMNRYYFDDPNGNKGASQKTIEFMIVTHADQDHTIGLKKVLENFTVKKIYMNRPWLYVDELFNKVNDGRITKESLRKRLREKYETIADIEDIADDKDIPIYEAFQGVLIESKLKVLSPSKKFYLDLLVESDKTPLEENAAYRQLGGSFVKIWKAAKNYVLSLIESWTDELLREDVETSAENETSVVLRGIVDGSGFLLTGDAGIRALTKAMDYMDSIGEDIQTVVSFYQIPHHGGRRNISPSVLDRMIGEKVRQGESRNRSAIACAAKGSDHPLKMVTNAYIRRGVTPYQTPGNVICHHNGEMPDRGWSQSKKIEFSDHVEEWEE